MSHYAVYVIDLSLGTPENGGKKIINGPAATVLHNNMLPVRGQIDPAGGQ